MTPRLRIASEQMAALLGASTRPGVDIEWSVSISLYAADAIEAEHERTQPHECPTDVGVTDNCPRCEGKPEHRCGVQGFDGMRGVQTARTRLPLPDTSMQPLASGSWRNWWGRSDDAG